MLEKSDRWTPNWKDWLQVGNKQTLFQRTSLCREAQLTHAGTLLVSQVSKKKFNKFESRSWKK